MGRVGRFGVGAAVLATLLLAGCTPTGSSPAAPATSSRSDLASTASGSTPEPTMVSSVTVDPRLPSAQQLPAGLLATTDADWLVATVTGSAEDESAPSGTVRVVDLISPDGVRYELPPLGSFTLDQWLPGTSLGLGIDGSVPPGAFAVVDLETGEEVARPDLAGLLSDVPAATAVEATFVGDGTTDLVVTVRSADAGRTVRLTLDGSVVAELDRGLVRMMPSPSGVELLAADGVTYAPVLLDLATFDELTVPAGVATCSPSTWLDGARWLASCGGAATAWFVVEDDVTWRLPVEPGSDVEGLMTDADGAVVLAVRSWDQGALVADSTALATPTTLAPADTGQAFAWGVVGSAVVGSLALPDATEGPIFGLPAPVTAWHAADGSTATLVPAPLQGLVTVFPARVPGAPVTGGWFEPDVDGTVWFHPAD